MLTKHLRQGLAPSVALDPTYFGVALERARETSSGWSLRYLRGVSGSLLPPPPPGMRWLGCEVGTWIDDWSNYLLVSQDVWRLAPLARHREVLNGHGLFGTVEDAWSFWEDRQRLFATQTEDMEALDPQAVGVLAIAGLDPLDTASPDEWIDRAISAEGAAADQHGDR